MIFNVLGAKRLQNALTRYRSASRLAAGPKSGGQLRRSVSGRQIEFLQQGGVSRIATQVQRSHVDSEFFILGELSEASGERLIGISDRWRQLRRQQW